jgi:hypothetical protein
MRAVRDVMAALSRPILNTIDVMLTAPESSATTIATNGSQGGIEMWPSESVANKSYDLANIGLILALIAGVIATSVVVWMGNVKESYLKTTLADANARAAEANARAAEADLARAKLEERMNPRSISDPGRLLLRLAQISGEGLDIVYDEDQAAYASTIEGLARKAGWNGTGLQPVAIASLSPGMRILFSVEVQRNGQVPNDMASAIRATNALASALREAGAKDLSDPVGVSMHELFRAAGGGMAGNSRIVLMIGRK